MRVQGVWGSQISRLSAHKGGKIVSPTHRPPLPPQEIFLVLISIRVWVKHRNTVRPEGLCQWKIPVKPSGIEPATFRHVAQCLNQDLHRLPSWCGVSPADISSRYSPLYHNRGLGSVQRQTMWDLRMERATDRYFLALRFSPLSYHCSTKALHDYSIKPLKENACCRGGNNSGTKLNRHEQCSLTCCLHHQAT